MRDFGAKGDGKGGIYLQRGNHYNINRNYIDRSGGGILPTGYFRPNPPLVWHNDAQCEWIAEPNRRILYSGENCEPTAAVDAPPRAAER